MSTTDYAAHVKRVKQQGGTPLSIRQFVKMVVEIYRMEQNESK